MEDDKFERKKLDFLPLLETYIGKPERTFTVEKNDFVMCFYHLHRI